VLSGKFGISLDCVVTGTAGKLDYSVMDFDADGVLDIAVPRSNQPYESL
jgi:hypothetical protein